MITGKTVQNQNQQRRNDMKPYKLMVAMGLLVLASSVGYAVRPSGAVGIRPTFDPDATHFTTGVVQRIRDGMVYLKTKEGTTREFSMKAANQEKLKGLATGDRLRLDLDRGDQITHISRIGLDSSRPHQKDPIVKGTIDRYDPVRRVVTLRLGDGITKSYRMKDAAATRMMDVKTGTRVSLVLDLENHMVEDFKTT
jgi:hypothetical protein